MRNCMIARNCTDFSATICFVDSCACNAISCAFGVITHILSKAHTQAQIIAYYYYYTNTTTNNTTIYSLNAVFAFSTVQFFCNFMQFLQSMQF